MASPRSRKTATSSAAPAAAPAAPEMSLATVIEATKAGNFVYTSAAFHAPFVASGDVEINPQMVNEAGEIATRATAKHLQETEKMTEQAQTQAAAAKPAFAIETGIEIPARTRVTTGLRAGRAPKYPFDQLEIGQSFFVPNEGDKPAAKALASTVAGANARHTQVVEGKTRVNRKGNTVPETVQLRKFKVFDSEKDGVKGARVFRVALDSPAA